MNNAQSKNETRKQRRRRERKSEAKRIGDTFVRRFPGPAQGDVTTPTQRTIPSEFEEQKSISRKVGTEQKHWTRAPSTKPDTQTSNSVSSGAVTYASSTPREEYRDTPRRKKRSIKQKTVGTAHANKVKRSIRGVVRIAAYWVAGVTYMFQFWIAILTLFGFAAGAGAKYTVGWIIDWFVDIPYMAVGTFFWALGMIVVIMGFTVCIFLYHKVGIRPFGGIISFIVTSVCIGFSLYPVLNLIPWIVLWVWYIHLFRPR